MNGFGYAACLVLSIIVLAIGIAYAVKQHYSTELSIKRPIHIMIAGSFVASVIVFIPIYMDFFRGEAWVPFKAFFIAIHNAIRLFIVDGEFDIIRDHVAKLSDGLSTIYSVYTSVLFVLAPILTFSLILSLIRNFFSFLRIYQPHYQTLYIFSDLNNNSLALAQDIRKCEKNDKKFMDKSPGLIVFADVYGQSEGEKYELIQRTKQIRAVCLYNDIEHIKYPKSEKKKIEFYIVGGEEDNNLQQAVSLYERFRLRGNTSIFVLSRSVAGELLLTTLSNQYEEKIKAIEKAKKEGRKVDIELDKVEIRRINPERALVNTFFYTDTAADGDDSEKEKCGWKGLFNGAGETTDGLREIRVLIAGLGAYGKEMLKTLVWFCQIEGFYPRIVAVDENPQAEDMLKAEYPELLGAEFNGNRNPNSAMYSIKIHSGVNVDSTEFKKILSEYRPTFVFAALGDDSENIRVATKIRNLSEQQRTTQPHGPIDALFDPQIVAVCVDTEINGALQTITNFKGEKYNIELIGSRNELYSYRGIIRTDFEESGKKIHIAYAKEYADHPLSEEEIAYQEEIFRRSEYNYRSSIAAAIHAKAVSYNIKALRENEFENLEADEKLNLGIQEHRRWIAWMRAEGYVFGGNTEKTSRNDLGKTQNLLTAWDTLPEAGRDQAKKSVETAIKNLTS